MSPLWGDLLGSSQVVTKPASSPLTSRVMETLHPSFVSILCDICSQSQEHAYPLISFHHLESGTGWTL